jgi:hypothetical protein
MKEMKLSFAVTVGMEQTDVNTLEEALVRQWRGAAPELLRQIMAQVERQALARRGACSGCGGAWRGNGRKVRRLETVVGVVRFERVRLRCAGCGRERYPLDEALGLEAGEQHTMGVRELALWTAVEVSYAQTEAFLAKFVGLTVGAATVCRMARAEGERLLAEDAAERQRAEREGVAADDPQRRGHTLVVQVDGTGVPNRATHGPMESKIGLVYSERAEVSRGRFALLDKRCVATLEHAQQLGQDLYREACRRGLEQAGQVVFVSDGANWTPHLQQMYFPTALVVLDTWHLARALQEKLGADSPLVGTLMRDALAGQPQRILARLRRKLRATPSLEGRIPLADLILYVTTNAQGIRNLPRAPLVGSGAIEKQVDVGLCRRLKTRGMSWFRPGAAALQRLRILKLNGDWEPYWNRRRAEQARRVA